MVELQILLQILGVLAITLFIVLLVYVIILVRKVNTKLDTILEMVSMYESVRDVAVAFAEGPGKMYIDVAKYIYAFVSPWLTKSEEEEEE